MTKSKIFISAIFDRLVIFSFLLGVPIAIGVHFLYRYFLKVNPSSLWVDILVEAHGLIFDIIFFSIILAVYSNLQDRKKRIERYKEELDDYRGWTENEAAYRIRGLMKRLQNESVKKIDYNNLHLGMCTKDTIKEALSLSYKLASLEKANLGEVVLDSVKHYRVNLKGANLWKARLTNSKFYWSELSDSDLANASLRNVTFYGATLQRAKLFEAHIYDSQMSLANLQEANLSRAILMNVNLVSANLQNSWFKDAHLERTDLSSADLRGADFSSVWIQKSKFVFSKIDRDSNLLENVYIKENYYVSKKSKPDNQGKLYWVLIPRNKDDIPQHYKSYLSEEE